MKAKPIMLQGTGSDVGKSVLTTAFCRIFAEDGYRVAPFKSQNMALNSYVTKTGGEIGRATAMQAEAAGVTPTVNMNPVLLKPNADNNSQVIFQGKPYQNMTAKQYFSHKNKAFNIIKESYNKLQNKNEIIVLEGGGSPAEINLKDKDLVNMTMAEMAEVPVILIASIEKGGVFASIVGTFDLLTAEEVERIKGIIINKFHGDFQRFASGVEFIENHTDKPVLGIIPYFKHLNLPEEDSLGKKEKNPPKPKNEPQIDIVIIDLPHISNFTDFDFLNEEPETKVRYVKKPKNLKNPDLIIIPGSKNTIADLKILYQQEMVAEIKKLHNKGVMIAGICGGYQMLGQIIRDPCGIESGPQEIAGIGLLDVKTELYTSKKTYQVQADVLADTCFFSSLDTEKIEAYEIHQGKTKRVQKVKPLFMVYRRNLKKQFKEGAISEDGKVWGTYLHGLFDNDNLRRSLVNYLREKKGLSLLMDDQISSVQKRKQAYQKFADHVRENLEIKQIYEIIFD